MLILLVVHFDKVFDVNVKGTLFAVQKALPLMRTAAPSSSLGRLEVPWERPPSACTANKGRYSDLKGTGIRVNVLSLGATTTPGLLNGLAKTGMQEALLAGLANQAPLERVGNGRDGCRGLVPRLP